MTDVRYDVSVVSNINLFSADRSYRSIVPGFQLSYTPTTQRKQKLRYPNTDSIIINNLLCVYIIQPYYCIRRKSVQPKITNYQYNILHRYIT